MRLNTTLFALVYGFMLGAAGLKFNNPMYWALLVVIIIWFCITDYFRRD